MLAAVTALLVTSTPVIPASAADPACGPLVDGVHQVATASQLRAVGSGGEGTGDCGLGANYQQVAAIDLSGGAAFAPIDDFSGTYDGGGLPITGLRVTTPGAFGNAGMFGYVGGGTLEDIVLRDVSVSTGTFTGSLVGYLAAGGSVARSSASGTVRTEVTNAFAGGLVGYMASGTDVTHSAADVAVTVTDAQYYAGGLVGQADGASIQHSYARGPVSLGGGAVAGLLGSAVTGTLINVYATGAVEDTSSQPEGWGLIGGGSVSVLIDAFWDIETTGQLFGGPPNTGDPTGATTADMTTFATFADASWDIVEGWVPFDDDETDDEVTFWGICPAVNDGYPFLLWEYDADPCSLTGAAAVASAPSVSCTPLPATAGSTLTCSVMGGDPGIDILWRAAYNPVFAEAGVTLDAAGSGGFAFTVPADAVGQELTVELVEWAVPQSLGVVGGPVPSSVPSGGGPAPVWLVLLAALAGVGLLRRSLNLER